MIVRHPILLKNNLLISQTIKQWFGNFYFNYNNYLEYES